jgi:glycosyltransferase involved in cell wall biosynthesis
LNEVTPKPSIIIPSHNQLPLLKNALRSLEAQTWDLNNLEVIAVDDGSKDGTADFLRSYTGKLQLRPVYHSEAKGRAGARNAGLRIAAGDPIILLDGDMEVAPEFITAHVTTGNGETVVLGKVQYHPDIRKSALTRYYPSRGAWRQKPVAEIPGRYFVTLNVSLPRWAFEKVGFFDENFKGYGGEDLDYGMRLQKSGIPFRTSERALSYHNHLRTLPDILKTLQIYGENSIPYLLEKHPELLYEMKLSLAIPLKYASQKSTSLVLKNLLVRMACGRLFYYPMSWSARLLEPYWIPGWLMNYLIFRNYSRGYLTYLKNKQENN